MDNNTEKLASKHPYINWFIQNHVAANLLMLGILFTGLYMVGFFGLFGQTSKLRLEAFPETEPTRVTITASINGSTPEDVEQGVTDKIEEALQGVQGIDKITSASTANQATISVDAVTDYDMDKLYDDIKTQVDTVATLPAEVEQVIVSKVSWQPSILWVTLHGNASEHSLKTEANRLKNHLLQNSYIEKIEIAGERDAEIRIEISENTLREYKLTLSQVATAINNASLDLSSGTLETNQGNLTLRIKAQAKNQTDYENLIIRAGSNGALVRLGDIATVTDGFTEQAIYSGFNGQPSLTLRLQSGKNANVIEADKAATAIVNEFSASLPKNITATIWNNRVTTVQDRINLFVENSALGVVLVFAILALFLNLRLAFWVALGIPISLSGAVILMYLFDISINLISLFGFILVLGIIVDDAIVIGESIFSWKKRTHNAPYATLQGTSRVSTAATFGVLTTVAAFLPLIQVDGMMGNMLGQIGAVVIFCLLFSLVESKLILPAHLYHTKVGVQPNGNGFWGKLQGKVSHGLERFVETKYLPTLTKALRQRYFTLLVFTAILVLAAGVVLGRLVPISMFPSVEAQDITLTVEMETNTPAERTIALAKQATEALRKADSQLMQEQNTDQPNITNISTANTDAISFTVRAGLADAKTRTLSAPQITNRWRQVLGEIQGAGYVQFSSRRRFSGSDVELEIFGSDRKVLREAGEALVELLSRIEGVTEVANSQNDTNEEIRIELKPEAHIYGITKTQLAQTVRSAFYGQEAERLQRGDKEIRVMVRYPKAERKSIADLNQLYIRTDNGVAVPLSAVATLSYDRSLMDIDHINGQRALIISADLDKDKTDSATVMETLHNSVFPEIQKKYDVTVRLGGEAEEDQKSSDSMKIGFIVSLGLIYILLAIPLKSYVRPIIIMSAIPFGIIGAIVGHLILGMGMSMMSLFGIIALSGVVVNDSLLLLTTIAQRREEGMGIWQAIHATGTQRFRPVILTSVTTFVGLMPMLFETSFQAQFLIPMAVSLGFGILFATAITLFLIPVVYAIFEDIKQLFFVEQTHEN